MNLRIENQDGDISLLDVIHFLKRQYKNIFATFLIFFGVSCVFIFTKPTIFESSADLKIGSNSFFIASPSLIESTDQIKYLYSSNVQILPIKNTAVIQVVSKNENIDVADNNIKETIKLIIKSHSQILNQKREEFIKLMELSKSNNLREYLSLIDSASLSKSTEQVSAITTKRLAYGGILGKGLTIAFFGSAFFALMLGLLFDNAKKVRKLFTQ